MISLYFIAAGFITIFFNDRIEHHLILFIPAILLILYGLIVGLSLVNNQNKKLEKRRIDSINAMGFLYSLMSLGIMLYKLKNIGAVVPDSLALVIALSHLAICITTSIAGLLFSGLIGEIFKKNFPVEKEVWVNRRSA